MGLIDRARGFLARRLAPQAVAVAAVAPPAGGAPAESPAAAAARILGAQAGCVVDVGAHHGHSTLELLAVFPQARVHAFEPEGTNHAAAEINLAGHEGRVVLHRAALSDRDGTATLQVNSHDGTHSLLEIGAQRFWGAWAGKVGEAEVPTATLDSYAAAMGIGRIDLLKMDIQGAELAALRGAVGLLSRQAIGGVLLEVMFQPLYRDQPLFWDIGAFLASHGYGMYQLFEPQYHPHNPNVLAWADVLFLAPSFLDVPEWERQT